MARDGRLKDLPAIEGRLRLRGLAAVKWEDIPYGKEEGQIALFTASPDSPLAMLYLHRRRPDYMGSFTDSLTLAFKKHRCVSKAAAEAAFGKAFEVMMVPHHHPDGTPPYPYSSLDVAGPDGRDIHVAFERGGCEILLSWPSPPVK
jgi:hypothetical protein